MLGLSSADRLGGDQGAAAARAEPGGYRCRDAGLPLGRAPVDGDGPNCERVFRRRDPGDRRLGGGTTRDQNNETSLSDRRGERGRAVAQAVTGPSETAHRRHRRRFRRRDLRAGAAPRRSPIRGHARRAEPDLHGMSVQQRRDCRSARHGGTALRLRRDPRRRYRRRAGPGDGGRPAGPACLRSAAASSARLRPAGPSAGDRDPLGRAARLRRGRGRGDAARLAGRRPDACCCAVSSKRWPTAGRL